ncbi:hypothetical protein CDEST_08331 [Colletotrichum destructivum]|uniref:Uncharacterized protein n=1 Tax=Colletotrichum destructivum TaxID=34406 RepID=A0AAX4IJ35_9PEZI|nr:hypothetical protein CDEST_08331 [Colletotrichum destructivum]
MDPDALLHDWRREQDLNRRRRPCALLAWLQDIWHDVGSYLNAQACILLFQKLFFRDVFLTTAFLVWVGRRAVVRNRWLFGVLASAGFADGEVGSKLVRAAARSSSAFAVHLALAFLVFPLDFWRSPAQPIPGDRHLAAWDVLAPLARTAANWLGAREGMREWRSLAEANPAFFCKAGPADLFSMYTAFSHYAALILVVRELARTFDGYQSRAVEEAGEAVEAEGEAELTAFSIWVYRARFLFWELLMQLAINVAFELIADAAGSLQCWCIKSGMKLQDRLPGPVRRLPFLVCFFSLHFALRHPTVSWAIDQVHMWVFPEEHQHADEDDWEGRDWGDGDEDDETEDDEEEEDDGNEEGEEDDGTEEGGDKEDDDDDQDNTSDTDEETDDENEDADEPDHIYMYKDDCGYVFEVKDGAVFERETLFTYDGEYKYEYRYTDDRQEVSAHQRATENEYDFRHTCRRKTQEDRDGDNGDNGDNGGGNGGSGDEGPEGSGDESQDE